MPEPHDPEPLPAGCRLRPPTLPPAPPGAPSTPPPGVPAPVGGDLLIGLNATRNLLLLLRMAVEAAPHGAEVPEARDTLSEILSESREDLVRELRNLRARLLAGGRGFPPRELATIRDVACAFAARGVNRPSLDRELRVDLFSHHGTLRGPYFYGSESGLDWEAARHLTGPYFAAWLLDHVVDCCADDAGYLNLAAFDARVYTHIMFALYVVAAGTSLHYGTAGAWGSSLPPQITQ
jgi:hypothetical protein